MIDASHPDVGISIEKVSPQFHIYLNKFLCEQEFVEVDNFSGTFHAGIFFKTSNYDKRI